MVGQWLLGGIGNYLVNSSERWWFIGLDGYDATTLIQIGSYLACVGAQPPALWTAALSLEYRTSYIQCALLVASLSPCRRSCSRFAWPCGGGQ